MSTQASATALVAAGAGAATTTTGPTSATTYIPASVSAATLSEQHNLDVAIQQLFDQQDELQSRLRGLLDARHGLDAAKEVDMLRHKMRVLESLVDYHGKQQ